VLALALLGLILLTSAVGRLIPTGQLAPLIWYAPRQATDFSQALYLIDLDRRAAVWLLTAPFGIEYPSLAPDQQRIAYNRFENGWRLHILDWFTGEDQGLADSLLNGSFPAWSPDGRRLAQAVRYGGTQIIDPLDGMFRQLTDDSLFDYTPAWSPDGRWIAFGVNQNLYAVSSDCEANCREQATQITGQSGAQAYPAWSPDGRFIAFLSSLPAQPNIFELYLVDTKCLEQGGGACAGQNALRVDLGYPGLQIILNPIYWSPDGYDLIFQAMTPVEIGFYRIAAVCYNRGPDCRAEWIYDLRDLPGF
jgi:dipeptidyl aminopeptidase/acylaminoacyl peptidase